MLLAAGTSVQMPFAMRKLTAHVKGCKASLFGSVFAPVPPTYNILSVAPQDKDPHGLQCKRVYGSW